MTAVAAPADAATVRRRAWIGEGGPAGDLGDDAWPGPEWLPVDVRRRRPGDAVPGGPDRVVDWLHAPGLRPVEPFLDETVDRLLRGGAEVTTTGLGALLRVPPGLPVRGVVAHVSRCGSTLVAQWLAAAPRHLVLSEPSVLDVVLRLEGLPAHVHLALVRGAVAALAQPRGPHAEVAHLKLDAWSGVHLPLLRAAVPGAPVLALARDPVEVLVSGLRQRGAHLVPGLLPARLFGMAADEPARLAPEDHAARVVGALLAALVDGPVDAHLDFPELPGHRAEVLALLGAHDDRSLDRVSGRHAKAPERTWEDDSADKRAAAWPALRAAVDRHAAVQHLAFRARAAATRWPR